MAIRGHRLERQAADAAEPAIAVIVAFTEGPTVDGDGNVYFSEMVSERIMKLSPSGALTVFRAHSNNANGLLVDPEGRLIAAEGADYTRSGVVAKANSAEGGARLIRAYDLAPDGSVSRMRVHYNFGRGRSADGMSIDSQGNLYASAGLHRTRGTSETLNTKCGVHVISPTGKLLSFHPIPEDTPSPTMRSVAMT